MASMEESLCSFMLSRSVVTSLIGTGANARLYAINLPQSCNLAGGPAATYEIISSTETQTLLARAGIVQSRVRITAYAATHSAATALARAIKNSGITELKGVVSGTDFRGVVIEEGLSCDSEQPTDGGEAWRYVAEFDLMISYLEG
jgi:hypothetical protein